MRSLDEKMWGYPVIELVALPAIYFIITLISLTFVFVGGDVRWYHPILPAILLFLYKGGAKAYMERVASAMMHHYATVDGARTLSPHLNPDDVSRIATDLARRDAERWGPQVEEMFDRPRTISLWLIFIIGRFALIIQIVTVVLWSIFTKITLGQTIVLLIAPSLIMVLINTIRSRICFRLAIDRWTSTLAAKLDADLALKQQLMERHNLKPQNIEQWIRMEVFKLLQAGVNPNFIRLESVIKQETEKP